MKNLELRKILEEREALSKDEFTINKYIPVAKTKKCDIIKERFRQKKKKKLKDKVNDKIRECFICRPI